MTTTLIIRDQYGIHPDDKAFVEEKLKEIAAHLRQFKLLEMSALEQVWVIGQALKELKPKIFEGQWENFCRDHFRSCSQRSIRDWMQLATFRPALLKEFRPELSDTTDISLTESTSYDGPERRRANSTKSTTYASSDTLPGIGSALKIVQGWMRQHRSKNRSIPKKSQPREYCPHCGQFLSKRVKRWMKEHSSKG